MRFSLRFKFLILAFFTIASTLRAELPNFLEYQLLPTIDGAQDNTYQGWSVDAEGGFVAVSEWRAQIANASYGVVKIYEASTGNLRYTLRAPAGDFVSEFGSAVAISGSYVVVGAAGSAVYVYDLNSSTPSVPFVTLVSPYPSQTDQFGNSVAISGTRVLVGDQHYGQGQIGRAYVFELSGPFPGRLSLAIANPTPVSSERFGASVAIEGTKAIVGAPGARFAYV